MSLPALSPGLRIVRRGPDHLQVGLYDGQRVVLPRTAAVEQTLARLLAHQPLDDDPESTVVVARLRRHGCLADDPAEPADPDDPTPVPGQRVRVAVLGRLPHTDPAGLISLAGLRTVATAATAHAVLVLTTGELDRDRLDPLMRRGTPHLVVRLVDGGALLGPFVVPGITACLRCIDAHLSLADPDHVAVTARYVRATATPREDGTPDVVDPVLPTLALAWAVRDVRGFLHGREPSTWSRTLRWGADPALREDQLWLRHPDCGCSWSADALASGTMGV